MEWVNFVKLSEEEKEDAVKLGMFGVSPFIISSTPPLPFPTSNPNYPIRLENCSALEIIHLEDDEERADEVAEDEEIVEEEEDEEDDFLNTIIEEGDNFVVLEEGDEEDDDDEEEPNEVGESSD